jgi:hypothetical protein
MRPVVLLAILPVGLAAWLLYRSLAPPAAAPVTVISPPAVHPEAPGAALQTNADAVEVFRRAFWREPAPADRILHAERREWVSETDGVRRWQWFLALEPGPELLDWLVAKNSFGLLATADGPAPGAWDGAPAWFPRFPPAGATVMRNAEGSLWLVHDRSRNLLHATDAGGGFTPR